MKHLGKVIAYLLLAVNAVFIGLLLLAAYSPYVDPNAHPNLSCFGLTFPIFLVINFCFLIFWLIVRYRFVLLPLAGFLLCYPQLRTYIPLNLHTDSIPENSIKLLSFNTMAFGYMEKKNGKNPVLTYLQESKADIICLQEYATSETAKIHLNERDIQKGLSNYPYRDVQTLGKIPGNKMAIYSKYPIVSLKMLDYNSSSNGSMMYELKIGNDTVALINNHLESNKLSVEDREVYEGMLDGAEASQVKSGVRLLLRKLAEATAIRAHQADVIAQAIKETPHRYIIVCGDFNDSPISYAHRTIAKDLDDAFVQSGRGLGISFNRNKFYFRIDNILVSKNLKAYNCTVDRSIKTSDHYPIWCYISKR